MIDRYIYAVTKELPEKSREEAGHELRALIEGMMNRTDDDLTEDQKVNQVLRELGDPKALADQYRGKERYLIGPGYFYTYRFVLKIVTLAIIVGISVVSAIGAIYSIESITEVLGNYLLSLFSAVLQGAAWVTGIFALMEYYDVSIESREAKEGWEPSHLPKLPDKKAMISRGESVFSIIISTVFLLLFFFMSERIGIYYSSGEGFDFVPMLNNDEVASIRFLILLIFTVNILVELIKIIKGRWTLKIAVAAAVLNVISAVLLVTVIYNPNIWNNDFVLRFEEFVPLSFERALVLTTAVIIIATMIESAVGLYKGFKYRT